MVGHGEDGVMRKILFVDDMKERHRSFKLVYTTNEDHVIPAYTPGQAIAAMRMHEFDEVWLDHDMSDEEYADQRLIGSGQTVAEWMIEHKDIVKAPVVFVHTMNSVAGPRMADLLSPHFPTHHLPFGHRHCLRCHMQFV